MSFSTQPNVERKILSILKVLSGLQKPAGSVIIAKHLKEHGSTSVKGGPLPPEVDG